MLIKGAHVITPGKDLGIASVRIAEDRIAEVGGGLVAKSGEESVDAGGLTLLPGFVDIHSHGRGGADFCDATDGAFDTISCTRSALRIAAKLPQARSPISFSSMIR